MTPSKKTREGVRRVIHREIKVEPGKGKEAMTADKAGDLLGWEETTEDKSEALLKDRNGVYVKCTNNVRNRPLYLSSVEHLVFALLHAHTDNAKRWQYNGEPIIIGKTGIVLNGQHCLVALKLAEQDRLCDLPYPTDPLKRPRKEYWKEMGWHKPVTMEKLVVYGVDESDQVVNTMDTCKPRSLADVIYRSEYFARMGSTDRKNVSVLLSYAVKFMWHRSKRPDAFTVKKSPLEALDFVNRHPRLCECVKHVWEEDKGGGIRKLYGPGRAAGLMYLMAASNTDPHAYRESPCEESIDWKYWDKAQQFWVLLNSGPTFKAVRDAIGQVINTEGELVVLNPESWKTSVLINAWDQFVLGRGFKSVNALLPATIKNQDGQKILDDPPVLAGIDMGEPGDDDPAPDDKADRRVVNDAPVVEDDDGDDPTPDEIAEEIAKIRGQKDPYATDDDEEEPPMRMTRSANPWAGAIPDD